MEMEEEDEQHLSDPLQGLHEHTLQLLSKQLFSFTIPL